MPSITHNGEGVQIQFEFLLHLAAVERWIITSVDRQKKWTLPTGYNTALIPIRQVNDCCNSVPWHFVNRQGLDRIARRIDRSSGLFDVEPRLFETSMEVLQAKAYVGWGGPLGI